MINLTKKVQEAGANSAAINTANGQKRLTPAEMRVQKDVNEMSLPRSCKPFWPHANDLLNFKLLIAPDEGIYKGGEFQFNIEVGANYPHEPPKVKCETKVFHPNIDLAGNVCLNILREEWKPVLSISAVIYGLQLLFLEPNPDDPLNKEAAEMFVANRRLFEQTVQRTMRGGMLNNFYFDKCAK